MGIYASKLFKKYEFKYYSLRLSEKSWLFLFCFFRGSNKKKFLKTYYTYFLLIKPGDEDKCGALHSICYIFVEEFR